MVWNYRSPSDYPRTPRDNLTAHTPRNRNTTSEVPDKRSTFPHFGPGEIFELGEPSIFPPDGPQARLNPHIVELVASIRSTSRSGSAVGARFGERTEQSRSNLWYIRGDRKELGSRVLCKRRHIAFPPEVRLMRGAAHAGSQGVGPTKGSPVLAPCADASVRAWSTIFSSASASLSSTSSVKWLSRKYPRGSSGETTVCELK
jgi:hypothetical protein